MKAGGKFGKATALWGKRVFLVLNGKLLLPVSRR